MMQCYMNITKQFTWVDIEHTNGSDHVPYFMLGKTKTKVGMITGSNIAVAASIQVCYRNLMLKEACKS